MTTSIASLSRIVLFCTGLVAFAPVDLARDAETEANSDGEFQFIHFAGPAIGAGSRDGTGTYAQFGWPVGAAVDGSGTLYVSDVSNHTIRKVSPTGVVSTFAGVPGESGSVDGTGTAARFNSPADTAVDSSGNVYVADRGNNTIRKISPTGTVTTLAGAPGQSGSVDGTGSAARFSSPGGVAVDVSGNVYAADTSNYTIRKISPAGVVTTLAGSAGQGGSIDATGGAARFYGPSSVAVAPDGTVLVADRWNHVIRKISAAGVVTTLAGLAGQEGNTDGTGTAARFNYPSGVTVDGSGVVYVADSFNSTIRRITPAGVVTTLAGSPGQTQWP